MIYSQSLHKISGHKRESKTYFKGWLHGIAVSNPAFPAKRRNVPFCPGGEIRTLDIVIHNDARSSNENIIMGVI